MRFLLLLIIVYFAFIIAYDFYDFYNKNQHKNYKDKVRDEYFWIVYFAFTGNDGDTYNNSVEYTGDLNYIDFRKQFIKDLTDGFNIEVDDILELDISDGFESGPDEPKKTSKIIYHYYIVKKNKFYEFLKNTK